MENHQFERLLHEIAELREHTDDGLRELRDRSDGLAAGLRELRQDARSWVDDARRHFGVLAEDLRGDMRLLGEGLATVNERLDRLEVRMDERFGETHALIRLSYHDLGRRVRVLEGSAGS